MVKITCDRCGTAIEFDFVGSLFGNAKEENAWKPSPVFVNVIDSKTHEYRKLDLCKKCEKEVIEFLNNYKIENKE